MFDGIYDAAMLHSLKPSEPSNGFYEALERLLTSERESKEESK